MIRNYLKYAVRNIRRSRLYSAINVSGLALGFAAAILIALWVQYQFSYDRDNMAADRIYRVTSHWSFGNADYTMPWTPGPLAGVLSGLAQVECATRISNPLHDVVLRHGDRMFSENNVFYADSTFPDVFTVHFLQGNATTSLNAPYSIVLTKTVAEQLFPHSNPMGKVLSINSDMERNGEARDYTVTGVIKDFPVNSHFHPKCLASFSSIERSDKYLASWYMVGTYTYFMLRRGASVESVRSQLPLIVKRYLGAWGAKQQWTYGLEKLTDIHLHSHLLGEIEPNGSIGTVYIFGAIGLFVLLVSIINFISLTMVGFSDRTREVGVRKVVGAGTFQVMTQLVSEGFILSLIAAAISISLVELSLPYFNELTGQAIRFTTPDIAIAVAGMCVLGVAAGVYPAMFLSSFKPSSILRKEPILKSSRVPLRKALTVLQFAIAVAIIASTIVTGEQLYYLQHKNLGFNKEQVIVIPLRQKGLAEKYPVLKEVFDQIPGVENVSGASGQLGNTNFISSAWYQGKALFQTRYLAVDLGFLKTMDIKLLSGRQFSADIPADTTSSILVNQAAAEKLDAMKLSGKVLSVGGVYDKARVIGVMKNFNYRPLLYPVQPLVVFLHPAATKFMVVRLYPKNMTGAIGQIEAAWKKTVPDFPLDWRFQDRAFEEAYKSDMVMKSMFDTGAGLSVFISLLGLFGLAGYAVEKRVKEVGIRKVLGASELSIISLLTRDFVLLVAIGGFIGCLASYYFINGWLRGFAYRVDLSVWPFLAAVAVALVAAAATVCFRTIRAATANPAEALRYE